MEKKALGKGLGALIPEKINRFTEKKDTSEISNLNIDQIKPNPYQPRKEFNPEALQELTSSIKEKGVIQPILVRKKKDGEYELIAGERRLRAAKLLKLNKIPAIIKDVNDDETLALSLIENIQREGLNPVEEACAYQELITKFNFTQEQIAQVMGKARSTINNTLRILKLPQKIQEYIKKNLLSFSHARTLLEIEDRNEQIQLAEKIVASELSVREVENLLKQRRPKETRRKKVLFQRRDPNIAAIEEELQHILGTRVRIVQHKKRGRVEIEFYSFEDLERILEVLKKQ
jgi:ParB family chromosome partitioning protein